MRIQSVLTLLLIITSLGLKAQTTPIKIYPFIKVSKDSVESAKLTSALNDFLAAAQLPNEENKFVLESEKIETYILLDEFKGLETNRGFKDDNFFKPHLTNVVPLDETQFLIQLSYIGINEGETILRASFELIAHKTDDSYAFSSPLVRNTRNWKVLKKGDGVFHYEYEINTDNVERYEELVYEFDKKLNITNKTTECYCTNNLTELLKLIGVNYKLDYNGRPQSVFSASGEGKKIIVLGNNNASFDNLDPHDLWHDRLSLVISRRAVNKPIDEACAYLYGGSWGITWEEILERFNKKVASNKESDWANYKENPSNFGESQEEHLMVDYVVNALIVEKIEKEKGFEGVWEFLNCGPYEKGNENYYQALEKLTGITKDNYNKQVWKLIKAAT